ncbi:hypothetical protein ACIQKE_02440 [Streptomyces griseoviridis]
MPLHAKKHHFIPQFLLQHFAGQRGKLVIHQVMSERRFNIPPLTADARLHLPQRPWLAAARCGRAA